MRRLLLLVIAASTTACFKADVANCAATCASSEDCPSGLVCTGAGRCAETASTVCTGGPDAQPDGVPGLITVTARDDRGLPATGVRVLAVEAGGTVIADQTTGSNGVTMVLAPGAVDITIIRTPSTGARLSTILGAMPGDSLLFGPERNEMPSVIHTVTWPTLGNAQSYAIMSSCDMQGLVQVPADQINQYQSADITLDPTCAGDHDVLVLYSQPGGVQPRYLIEVEQPDDNVTMTGAWDLFTPGVVNLQQLPASVPPGTIQAGAVNVFRTGEPARGPGVLISVIPGGGGASANLELPPIGEAREMLTLLREPVEGMPYQQILERIAPVGEYNLSVEPAMVPWVMTAPVFDTANRRVRWAQMSSGPSSGSGDLIAAELKYGRSSTIYTWRIFAPVSAATPTSTPGEVELVLPDLPGSDPFEPQPGDTTNGAWLGVYGFQPGYEYAQARARADAAVSATSDPIAPADAFFADTTLSRYTVSQYEP